MIKFKISNCKFTTNLGELDEIYVRICTIGIDTVFGVLEHKMDLFSTQEACDKFQKKYHLSSDPNFIGGLEDINPDDDYILYDDNFKVNGEGVFMHNWFYLLNNAEEVELEKTHHEKRLEEVERVDFDENGDMITVKEKHWIWVPVNKVTKKEVLSISMKDIENLTPGELFNFSYEKFSEWFKNIYPEAKIKLI